MGCGYARTNTQGTIAYRRPWVVGIHLRIHFQARTRRPGVKWAAHCSSRISQGAHSGRLMTLAR